MRFHFTPHNDKEKVIRIVHRHWFDIFQQLLFLGLALIFLVGGSVSALMMFPVFSDESFRALFFFVQNVFLMIGWLYLFLIWIDYRYDVWIVTTERIINIEQKGLFNRQVSELHFSRLQDVTTDIRGFLATVLNFGDLHVQTASQEKRFLFRQVPDPYHLKSEIMGLARNHHFNNHPSLSESGKKEHHEPSLSGDSKNPAEKKFGV